MKLPRSPKGFTLVELLVVISIIAILASFAVPAVTSAIVKGQLIGAVNNVHQIHVATMTMSMDGAANSDSMLQWPGDLHASTDTGVTISNVSDFVARLVKYDYLKASDLKVFATSGIMTYKGGSNIDGSLTDTFNDKNCAFKLYWVKDTDPSNSLFLATKNYTYNTAFNADSARLKPFGDKGFVVLRKGGDASSLKRQQASGPNVVQIVGNVPGVNDPSVAGSEGGDNCYQTQQ